MIQNYVALKTTFKKHQKKQYTFRSASGKEQQLDYGEIDRRNRRYCTDTESNDMIHLGSDHRSVIAHFRFPCVKKMRGLNNKEREQNLCKKKKLQDSPDTPHQWNHAKIQIHQKHQDMERICDEL